MDLLTLKTSTDKNGKTRHLVETTPAQLDYVLGKKSPYKWNIQSNKSLCEEHIYRGDNHFKGGTYEDLITPPKMDDFIAAKNKIEESGLLSRVQNALGERPKRRRMNSEHEGDWEYDRQWEIAAFNSAKREPSPNKFVKLIVDFTISAGSNADSINKYGAVVWGISQILEELGMNVNIVMEMNVTNLTTPYVPDTMYSIHTTLKETMTYISPTELAYAMRSLYYRRTLFGADVMLADMLKQTVCNSLGYCHRRINSNIKYDNDTGDLIVTAGIYLVDNNIKEIVDEILKAVNKG